MKRCCCLTVVSCVLFAATAAIAAENQKWSFGDAKVGPPKAWIVGVTGAKKGRPPKWEVIQDDGHNVLAQLEAGGANGDFPVCLKKKSSFKEGTVSVRLRPISGSKDQAGGVVFRAKDKDNFYVARANALENNVSFYVTQDGKRKTIKYWEDVDVALGQWHELKVEAKGAKFKVWLNNKFVGEVEDPAKTFTSAGMAGFWTKADSVTYLYKLTVR